MCKVSVCIPTYNSSILFRDTLDSLKSQTGIDDFEIIITDDSTNDFVYNTVKEYNFKGRLRYYRNSPALGSPANWNKCIEMARGEYIKILHHDDWFNSEKSLATFVRMLDENPDAHLAFSASRAVQNNSIIYTNCPDHEFLASVQQDPHDLILGNKIGAPSATIVRKKDIPSFDPRLKWLVDIEWYIQIISKNRHIIFNEEYLVNIGIHEKQATNSCWGNPAVELRENFYVFRKHLENHHNSKIYIRHLNKMLERLKYIRLLF